MTVPPASSAPSASAPIMPDAGAAVDDLEVALGDQAAEFTPGFGVFGQAAGAGAAEDEHSLHGPPA